MRWPLSAIALMLFVVATAPATVRAERLPVKAYTTADGLAHVRVTCAVPDSRGFVWFCGPQGLSRFDGQGFATYGIPQGLANVQVTDFLESSRGTYWVATNGGGVYRFSSVSLGTVDPAERHADAGAEGARSSRFTAFRVGDNPQTNRVNALYEDRAGRLWAGTDGGLFCFDERIDPAAFRRVELGLPGRPDLAVQVWAFAEDREGHLFIGTSWGLADRLPDGRTIHTAIQPAQGNDQIRALLVDRDDRLWIGHETGLIVLRSGDAASVPQIARTSRARHAGRDAKRAAMSNDAVRYGTDDGVSGGRVRAIIQSSDGRIWIATWEGLTQFDGERFTAFRRAQGITIPIALGEDHDGNIWIGTLTGGALRLARHGFTAYGEADGLADFVVGAVFENNAGEVHVVSNNQRIHRFDRTRFTAVRPNLVRDVADPVNAGTALQDRSGEWWIPGGAGLYRFPAVKRVEELGRIRPKAIYTSRDGLAGDDVFRLFGDSRGDIWIGRRTPTRLVLTRWEHSTGKFHRYSDADGLPAFSRTMSFAEDPSGNVWIGFQNGGLARYKDGRFALFTQADGAPGGGVTAIHLDARNRLWVGAVRPGLTRIDSPVADRPRFVPYGETDGLSGGAVGCITEDGQGRLYLCRGSSRIDRFDPATGHVRHYTEADGLAGSDLTVAFHDRHGSLWFGSYDGLFRLVPGPDRPQSPPDVLIGSIRVAGLRYLAFDLGQAEVPRFDLDAGRNQLQIEFFALGAGLSDGLRYQYRLEGADENWSAPTDRRDVNYASLSPGHYRFVVRAVTADGSPNPRTATVEFTILPPIWQRWWFRGSGVLGVILVILAVHRYRVARLLALERVRMRIAADLHDDIGGSLSRISIQSEVACREAAALGEQPVARLTDIAGSARELVDGLGDVVWCVDPRRDDLASVCRRIREYADDVLAGGGVRWKYTAAPGLEHVRLDPQARRNLFLLLKEAVTNVVRHAHARSASLDIRLAGREFRAVLRDDGRGFLQDALAPGDDSDCRGMASMRGRAERLGARLSIESAPGTGTTVVVDMTLPHRWQRMTMLLPGRLRSNRIGAARVSRYGR